MEKTNDAGEGFNVMPPLPGLYPLSKLYPNLGEGAHAIIMGTSSSESSVVGAPVSGGGIFIVPVSTERLDALAIRFTDSP